MVRVRFLRYISGFQGFRVSGFQGFRVSGFQGFRVSGFATKARRHYRMTVTGCHDKYSNYYIIGCQYKTNKRIANIAFAFIKL
ncbi:MAG TPA: hypothetical protein DDW27_01675 [Bacteroidales bacterium]|nr:hypothetical protein [Bacteroidales bacterium]